MGLGWRIRMSQVETGSVVFGVNLLADAGQLQTNLGAVYLPDAHQTLKVSQLRTQICQQLITHPANFSICTKQGWSLTAEQEEQLCLDSIITNTDEVLIKPKCDEPKCGIQDKRGNVIGFVHAIYNTKLKTLRNMVTCQILQGSQFSESFQFLDGNGWPISNYQESHMTIYDVLNTYCVPTNIQNKSTLLQFSPPKYPPLKKLKCDRTLRALSFRSGKDLTRQISLDAAVGRSSAKQVLISYVRSEAAEHALKLKEQLTAQGCTVYLDVHEILTGVDWQDSLNFAVSECQVFVPLVTHKYGETQWTNREVKLADVLGKYILPVSFLNEWPPRCLAIQFATTQFIPWIPPYKVKELSEYLDSGDVNTLHWSSADTRFVAEQICNRIKSLNLSKMPSLMKRGTIVKSCACLLEDNDNAIVADRQGKPLIMICLHPQQHKYGEALQVKLEAENLEVWCTTRLDRSHLEHIDSLASSQEGVTYSILTKDSSSMPVCNEPDSTDMVNIGRFQEKADDASVVLLILSQDFSTSRTCQQQVFYCEHRKRVIPVLYEDFLMPDWLTMLVGSHGLERKNDEDFQNVLLQRIKGQIQPGDTMASIDTPTHSDMPTRRDTSSFSPSINNQFNMYNGSLSGSLENIDVRTCNSVLSVDTSGATSDTRVLGSSSGSHMARTGFKRKEDAMDLVSSSNIKGDNVHSESSQNGTSEQHENMAPTSLTSMKTLILSPVSE